MPICPRCGDEGLIPTGNPTTGDDPWEPCPECYGEPSYFWTAQEQKVLLVFASNLLMVEIENGHNWWLRIHARNRLLDAQLEAPFHLYGRAGVLVNLEATFFELAEQVRHEGAGWEDMRDTLLSVARWAEDLYLQQQDRKFTNSVLHEMQRGLERSLGIEPSEESKDE